MQVFLGKIEEVILRAQEKSIMHTLGKDGQKFPKSIFDPYSTYLSV